MIPGVPCRFAVARLAHMSARTSPSSLADEVIYAQTVLWRHATFNRSSYDGELYGKPAHLLA